jgi:hypothetical protein
MAVYFLILDIQEVEDWRIEVLGKPWQNVSETLSQQKS